MENMDSFFRVAGSMKAESPSPSAENPLGAENPPTAPRISGDTTPDGSSSVVLSDLEDVTYTIGNPDVMCGTNKTVAAPAHSQLQAAMHSICEMAESFLDNVRMTINKVEDSYVPFNPPFLLDCKEKAKQWVWIFVERAKALGLRDDALLKSAINYITGEILEQAEAIGGPGVRNSWKRLKWSLLRLETTVHPTLVAGIKLLEAAAPPVGQRPRQAAVQAEMSVNNFVSSLVEDAPDLLSTAAIEKLKKYLYVPMVVGMLPPGTLGSSFLEDPFDAPDLYTTLDYGCRTTESTQDHSSKPQPPSHSSQPVPLPPNGSTIPVRKSVKKRRRRGRRMLMEGAPSFLPPGAHADLHVNPSFSGSRDPLSVAGQSRALRVIAPPRIGAPMCPTTDQSLAGATTAEPLPNVI